MPKQSRGFWTCEYCAASFDAFEEVSYHESYGCSRRPPAPPQNVPQHEMPYSDSTNRGRPPSQATPASPQHFSAAGTTYGFRRYLFMGQDNARLTRDDATMCRNIELFEVDAINTTDASGNPLTLGTVGLRCIHCIGDRTAASGNANFPRCVAEIGDCLREIAEGHLWRCERSPTAAKQILGDALTTRQRAKQEGGQPWHIQENSRRLLLNYCAYMSRELRLMDKYPMNSGVVIQPDAPPQRPPPTTMQQRQQVKQDYNSAGAAATNTAAPQNQSQGQQHQPSVTRTTSSPSRRLHDAAALDPFGTPARGVNAQFASPTQRNVGPPASSSDPFTIAGFQQGSSIGGQESSSYGNMSVNFPFVCEPSGHWICKFCQNVHPQYRDPHYLWTASNKLPPPEQFIDHHLRVCRMYQQSLMQDYPTSLQPPMMGDPFSYQPSTHGSYPPGVGDTLPALGVSDFDQFGMQAIQPPVPRMSAPGAAMRDLSADTPLNRAMAHLDANDLSMTYTDGTPVPDRLKLVANDDQLLLTDYYYYLMRQLRQCRFAESDRRTRGGKRDTVELGYGGLQCVHCAKLPNARKFFWSSVDRLANSFAEIPGHILKCRACPKETQEALLTLKGTHADQMSRLPRGSQKVYFRRMWRRVHEEDTARRAPQPQPDPMTPAATNSAPSSEPPRPERLDPFTTEKLNTAMNSPGTHNSEESVMLLERSPAEAAKALADSAIQAGPPSPSSRVLLAIPNDKEWLSDNDIFIRQQVEVFCATREDAEVARAGNKYPIEEGTVGIRCIHCALSKAGNTDNSTMYPFSLGGIYEAVREFHRYHLDSCKNTSPAVRSKLSILKGYSSLTSVSRNWYVTAAKSLGLVDTKNGIRASGESVPLSSRNAFSFSDSNLGKGSSSTLQDPSGSPALTPRKRSTSDSSPRPFEDNKRQTPASFAFEDVQGNEQRPNKSEDSRSRLATEPPAAGLNKTKQEDSAKQSS
uniref:Uncharacterized protein n=1 Tax=Entomoneis paludosa TaxID=265537 RepID=A0A7S3DR52_9STRA|mmetsp:Transcript_30433/g.63535  ORF Transcript_30433/g.63535 Transcript_30433/m.63535 type:complete len:975 (+) Transcript_30433:341-3265(+)